MEKKKIEHAIEQLKQGKLIIVADDDTREAEGDLVGLASLATDEMVNYMVKHARGLICAPMSSQIAKQLQLHAMVSDNTELFGTAFTVSVDHVNTTTGISTADRTLTIKSLAQTTTQADALHRPGHIFPLIAKDGGVLERRGHTEAAIDLAKLAKEPQVAYICEILNDDGTMARRPQLEVLAAQWDMSMITVEELAQYLTMDQNLTVKLPTRFGDFELSLWEDDEHKEHLLLSKGDISALDEPLLLRIHSECLTGDVFGSLRCDCGEQLQKAMQLIQEEGRGAIIYLRQEGRGIGLKNKLKTYQLQEKGRDTYEANIDLGFLPDERSYDFAAKILHNFDIRHVRLLTNNPHKIKELEQLGIRVTERISLEVRPNKDNQAYLNTKKFKFNHQLTL